MVMCRLSHRQGWPHGQAGQHMQLRAQSLAQRRLSGRIRLWERVFYQMEQGLVICPSGKKFPFWQVSRTAAQPGREGVGASAGVTLGPRRLALGALGQAAQGILGAEVCCDRRVDRLTQRDLVFLLVMPRGLGAWEVHR